ncbi:hypothetical protein B0J14DRAFT_255248 [Halenospora varia]|nr:hypothetical protein B0J14DRAFT_255248 [Halenospora varia]
MLAARDQENLVHGHQAAAASKPLNQGIRTLQPKTPGNKYPKTPLKIPLNDENAPTIFGGKSEKGKGLENMGTVGKKVAAFDKNAFVTPLCPRTRAPLGMKTTNAKTKGAQTPGLLPENDLEKTQQKQPSARRPKKVTHAETVKLEVHGDESPLHEREVEYCPPKVKDIPYQSDVFPDNCLNYDVLKPSNRMGGIHGRYYNKVDEQGRTRLERELEESYANSTKAADEQIRKMMEEEWTVGDVPETFRHLRKKESDQKAKVAAQIRKAGAVGPAPSKVPAIKAPATIASRKAASALSVAPKSAPAPPRATKPKPTQLPSFLSRSKPAPLPVINPSTVRNSAANVNSRSTIGYSKGRSASGALQKREGGFTRSVSNLSQSSDTTITPARLAQKQAQENEEWKKRLGFLAAFDVDEEDLEPGLRVSCQIDQLRTVMRRNSS